MENAIKQAIEETYSDNTLTAVGTLGSVSSEKASMNRRTYSYLLLDEAAQSPEPETCCALDRMDDNAGVCFAGDYKQLPPFSRNQTVKEYTQLSMMERLSKLPGVFHVLLDTQYRMVEPIARWPSRFFYGSRLKTISRLCEVDEPPKGFAWPSVNTPMVFVHHIHSHETTGTSPYNTYEVELIEGLWNSIFRERLLSM